MKQILNKLSTGTKNTPKKLFTYAVTTGDYAGEILIYIEKNKLMYGFLAIPTMENRDVPVDKYVFAVENNILETAGKIDSDVFKVCKAQYEVNKDKLN